MNTPLSSQESTHILETILLLERQQRMLDDALRVLRPMVGQVPSFDYDPRIYVFHGARLEPCPPPESQPSSPPPPKPPPQKKVEPPPRPSRSDFTDKLADLCGKLGAHGSQFGNAEVWEVAKAWPALAGLTPREGTTRIAQGMHNLRKRWVIELAGKEGRHPMWVLPGESAERQKQAPENQSGFDMLDQIHREIEAKKRGQS